MRPLVLVGAGNTSKALANTLRESGREIAGRIVEPGFLPPGEPGIKTKVLPRKAIPNLVREMGADVFVALGYSKLNQDRFELISFLLDEKVRLISLISKRSLIADDARISEGVFVGPFVEIQPGASVGIGTFVWSSSVIGHGSEVGSYNWISAGSVIGGDSVTGSRVFTGLNSTVNNSTQIGDDCFIASGVTVSKSMQAGSALLGNRVTVLENSAKRFFDLGLVV